MGEVSNWEERFEALKSGRRGARVNMIAGYRERQLIAPFTVEGACNRSVFETWIETCLVPTLEPGQAVIIDNATLHHGGRIEALITATGDGKDQPLSEPKAEAQGQP